MMPLNDQLLGVIGRRMLLGSCPNYEILTDIQLETVGKQEL